MLFAAMLVFCFEFKGCVNDAVLLQFRTDSLFDLVRSGVCYNVHGGVVTLTVHAPNVNVVNALYAFNCGDVFSDFVNVNAVGRFFKEQVDYLS